MRESIANHAHEQCRWPASLWTLYHCIPSASPLLHHLLSTGPLVITSSRLVAFAATSHRRPTESATDHRSRQVKPSQAASLYPTLIANTCSSTDLRPAQCVLNQQEQYCRQYSYFVSTPDKACVIHLLANLECICKQPDQLVGSQLMAMAHADVLSQSIAVEHSVSREDQFHWYCSALRSYQCSRLDFGISIPQTTLPCTNFGHVHGSPYLAGLYLSRSISWQPALAFTLLGRLVLGTSLVITTGAEQVIQLTTNLSALCFTCTCPVDHIIAHHGSHFRSCKSCALSSHVAISPPRSELNANASFHPRVQLNRTTLLTALSTPSARVSARCLSDPRPRSSSSSSRLCRSTVSFHRLVVTSHGITSHLSPSSCSSSTKWKGFRSSALDE